METQVAGEQPSVDVEDGAAIVGRISLARPLPQRHRLSFISASLANGQGPDAWYRLCKYVRPPSLDGLANLPMWEGAWDMCVRAA